MKVTGMAKEDCYRVFGILFIYCFGCVLGVKVATETNYTFKLEMPGKPELIDWRHNKNLVVEWEPNKAVWYQYEKRASLNNETGDLSLKLIKEDSGSFVCLYQLAGSVKTYKMTIEVIDRVPKPEVTCQLNDKNVTLACSVNDSVPAEFKWEGPNRFSHVGKSLQITREQNFADAIYYCTANNEVSKETAEFKLEHCQRTTDEKTNVGTIVGIVIGILLLAAVITGAAIFIKKNKGRKRSDANHPNTTKHVQDPVSIPLTKPDVKKH